MLVSRILAAALKRDRMIVTFGLAGVTVPSWAYQIYMELGNAPGSRDGHVIEPSAQPPFGGDLVS